MYSMHVQTPKVTHNYKTNTAVLNARETDLLKFELKKVGYYYHVNAWGRTSIRSPWRQVWHDRVHLSYLKALGEFNDTGAALADWKNQLQFS